jgi:ATP-dependent Clp protease ATP-binding subunit ClpA
MGNGTEPIPTPRYHQIIKASQEIARETENSHLGVEHLFLAIIRDEHAVPTQVLGRMVNLEEAETRLLEVMSSASYKTSSSVPED